MGDKKSTKVGSKTTMSIRHIFLTEEELYKLLDGKNITIPKNRHYSKTVIELDLEEDQEQTKVLVSTLFHQMRLGARVHRKGEPDNIYVLRRLPIKNNQKEDRILILKQLKQPFETIYETNSRWEILPK